MPSQTLAGRVESLESRVAVLEQLPAKFDALALQISQMREEIRGEFSALRTEIRAGDEETRRVLRDEIRAGDEETRRHALVLHEDAISRIALIEEGRKTRRSKGRCRSALVSTFRMGAGLRTDPSGRP